MPPRPRLSPEEQALWARVAATVTPLAGNESVSAAADPDAAQLEAGRLTLGRLLRRIGDDRPEPASAPNGTRKEAPGDTLDGGWDRRLRQGSVAPDRTIDLHGHTLATAHAALEHALARAIADDVRLLLVVTGKPPKGDDQRRGLIRASIGDWLSGSGYRDRIAAIRHAHPRHGGSGALYLILRRRRGG